MNLERSGIKVKLVEPGVTTTAFGGRSMDVLDFSNLPDYTQLMKKIDAARARFTKNSATPELVAATIFAAANDQSEPPSLSCWSGCQEAMAFPTLAWLADADASRAQSA